MIKLHCSRIIVLQLITTFKGQCIAYLFIITVFIHSIYKNIHLKSFYILSNVRAIDSLLISIKNLLIVN